MILCYSLRSPDNKQQRVFENPKAALEYLVKCPPGWSLEEFFDGTISRGTFATRTDDNEETLKQAITLYGLCQLSGHAEQGRHRDVDSAVGRERHESLRIIMKQLGEQSRHYALSLSTV